MATETDCIFCKIIAGEIPSTKVAEDDSTYVFMDINPATRGHALVIPKRHTQDITTIDPADLAAVTVKAQEIAKRAKEVFAADGVNLLNCCGSAAWQTVFHFHLHVIPRYVDDGLIEPWKPGQGGDADVIAAAGAALRG
ncbi:HIT family protein [Flexivirga oryzae]|uniref:Histidine triad (HIT) family protein n=1 Tax=Flexivirga oryzae TaxID=1794944 RepID=A0A839NBL8_9MICO|nr:HIT family protein [Flexivirga oryzae]MBB2894607.1 histidine triad (HIT) family protein [Flexivirga oryzae]